MKGEILPGLVLHCRIKRLHNLFGYSLKIRHAGMYPVAVKNMYFSVQSHCAHSCNTFHTTVITVIYIYLLSYQSKKLAACLRCNIQ